MELLTTKTETTSGRTGLDKTSNQVLVRLRLRCLSDLPLEMSSRKLVLRAWNLGKSLCLSSKFENGWYMDGV